MRTVLATPFTPTLDSGRSRRSYAVLRALAAAGEVDVVHGVFGAPEPDPAYRELPEVAFHPVPRPGTIERLPAYLRARFRGVPDAFARAIWPGVATAAEALAERYPEARIVAEGPVAAAALLPLAGRQPLVYCAHNLESSFRHRLGSESIPHGRLERFERLVLERYAESWMVSAADIEGARRLAPAAELRLVPNVVDVRAIHPVRARSGERSVLFVADLGYKPNRDGLAMLIGEAMPRLWEQAPEVRLLVAGKGSDAVSPGDERVEALGFVPDLAALYEAAGCVAVPLLEGGGSPLKFVEALAYGAPIVATPKAAAGLDVEAGEHYVEAEANGPAFARGILAALDPATGNSLGQAGRELAEREYSIEMLEQCLAPTVEHGG